jgi:hypothetical protein
MVLAFACFVALGLGNSMLGVAWPSIRQTFGLPLDALVYLLVSSTIGFVAGSVLTSGIMARIGIGWLLVSGNVLGAVGLWAYSLAPEWWILVAFGLFTGWMGG